MFLKVLEMVLPIFVTLLIGVMVRKRNILDEDGCEAIKKLVSSIMLPVVLFNAFLFADYSKDMIMIIIVVFVSELILLGLGYLLRRFIPDHANYFPFLLCTMECGALGYPLIAMLYGAKGVSELAIMDASNCVFTISIVVPLLLAADGSSAEPRSIIKNAVTSPTFIAMLLGIAMGLLVHLDDALVDSVVFECYKKVGAFIAGPTGMLILLTVGYGIVLRKDLIKPVVFTALTRLVASAALCAVGCLIVFRFIPFDKDTLVAMMIAFALPASYSILIFAKFEGHKEYASTTISFETILYLLTFIGITIYAIE